ncbi:MAG: hypothetical protein M1833_005427 [Piccolia ochrophora]|nr:MAG: hypothetical protein M1833_005427 [Piccolia ochrophora]
MAPPEDPFLDYSDTFVQWFRTQHGAAMSPKIAVADLRRREAGRGIVAVADIAQDEDLFTIPRGSLLTVDNSELREKAPELLGELDSWLSLVLTMIYEYLLGAQSKWKPYFDILPERFDTLMFWSPEELAALQASTVVHKVGKGQADDNFRLQLLPRIQSRPELFRPYPVLSSDFSRNDLAEGEVMKLAHRFASTILAYAFDIEKPEQDSASGSSEDEFVTDDEEEESFKGMVPLADLLNADADRNNAHLISDHLGLTMKALRSIQQGDEVFNDYGSLPRSDLLRRYGYCTPGYAPFDVVEIPVSNLLTEASRITSQGQVFIEARLDYWKDHGILEDGYDLIHPTKSSSAFPDELMIFVNTLLLSENDFEDYRTRNNLPKPIRSPEVLGVLCRSIVRRQGAYGTTLEHDQALLENETKGRAQLAIAVRLGEKMILREALVELAGFSEDKLFQEECLRAAQQTLKRRGDAMSSEAPKRYKDD